MSHTSVRQLEQATQQAQEWINELTNDGDFEAPDQAYAYLRAVLHAMRDRLTPEEVAHFGAQMPMMVRGFYFEGWRPARAPNDFDTPEEFFDHVEESLGGPQENDPPEQVAQRSRAVVRFLDDHVDEGQMRHVRAQFPKELVEALWEPREA